MTLYDAGLVVAAQAVNTAWTHMQAHSGAPGAAGTSNVLGSRAATTGNTVDGDGDITKVAAFTGLGASVAVPWFSYWSASTGGTCYGIAQNTGGDANANAAGALTVTVVESGSAT